MAPRSEIPQDSASFYLQALVYDVKDGVKWVDFYAETNWLGRATNTPYRVRGCFCNPDGSFYRATSALRAEVTYASDEVAVSAPVMTSFNLAITAPWHLRTGQVAIYYNDHRPQYYVQSSESLIRGSWQRAFTNIIVGESLIVDETAKNTAYRFYSVRH